MSHETQIKTRYLVEFGIAMALYVGIMLARRSLLTLNDSDAWQSAVRLAPVLPIWLVFWTVVRHYQRMDEYQQVLLLKVIAFCAGILACLTSSYSFFMDAFHLPQVSIEWAWPVLAICWGFGMGVVQIRDRLQTA